MLSPQAVKRFRICSFAVQLSLLLLHITSVHSFGHHHHFGGDFNYGSYFGRSSQKPQPQQQPQQQQQHYSPAAVTVYPQGFAMSIPARDPDVKSVRFEGSCLSHNGNQGDFSYVARKPVDGRWMYANRETQLQLGSVIVYRVVAVTPQRGRGGYVCDENAFAVEGL